MPSCQSMEGQSHLHQDGQELVFQPWVAEGITLVGSSKEPCPKGSCWAHLALLKPLLSTSSQKAEESVLVGLPQVKPSGPRGGSQGPVVHGACQDWTRQEA